MHTLSVSLKICLLSNHQMTDFSKVPQGGIDHVLQNSRASPVCFLANPSPILLRVPWIAEPGVTSDSTKFRHVLEDSTFRDLVNFIRTPRCRHTSDRLHHFPSLIFYLSLFLDMQLAPVQGGAQVVNAEHSLNTTHITCLLMLTGPLENCMLVFPRGLTYTAEYPLLLLQYRSV